MTTTNSANQRPEKGAVYGRLTNLWPFSFARPSKLLSPVFPITDRIHSRRQNQRYLRPVATVGPEVVVVLGRCGVRFA
jgi:hypothetical protein